MKQLPEVMVAPNGARKTKSDHPAIPISVAETVVVARQCHQVGADGLHAHVRDTESRHILDAGLYRELLQELAMVVPGLSVQITTEAVGRYSPSEQRQLVRDVMPSAVSFSVREMMSDNDRDTATQFYHWASAENIAVQHILYDSQDVELLSKLISVGVIRRERQQMIFVLGRYTADQQSSPDDLQLFLDAARSHDLDLCEHEWAVCAFGYRETDCLEAALRKGGKARVGFENSFYNRDGSLAEDNMQRVAEIVTVRDKIRAKS